jgi:hypothetical protein
MPSRAAHLIAFLTIVSISVSAHIYIYRQFARMIRRDFPRHQAHVLRAAKGLYIFFGKQITFDATLLTQILIYPFAVWQMLMLVWAVILIPIGIVRAKWVTAFWRSTRKLLLKPILRVMRRTLRPRRDPSLMPTEEIA